MFNRNLLNMFGLVLALTFGFQTANAQLIWADEFNGSSVNTSNWGYDIGTGGNGWGNNELQYYRSENATVGGGLLTITARRENFGGRAYTSARLKTQGKRSWTYGFMEANIKMPVGQGFWPAFWMIGSNFSSVGWPACGELDIMEHVNYEGHIVGSMHWNGTNGYSLYNGTRSVGVTGWHKYQLNWNNYSLRWYVDGVLYLTGNIGNNINSTEEFHRPFFFILNLAVGGVWPGSPNSSTPFPAQYQIDYVRVYRQGAEGNFTSPEDIVKKNMETEDLKVEVFPNPVKDEIHYTVPAAFTNHDLMVTDLSGKAHISQAVVSENRNNSVDARNLTKGLYLLQVSSGSFRKTIKIHKQ